MPDEQTKRANRLHANTRWWEMALGLALVAVAIALVVLFARVAIRAFGQLEAQIATAIVTAFAAVLIAVLSASLTRLFDRRARAEADQQSKRVPVYEEFVTGLLKGMGATTHKAKRKPMDEFKMVELFGEFTEKVLVWGSDEVLLAWLEFKAAAADQTQDGKAKDPLKSMRRLEGFFLALRSDLGLSNRRLKEGDLLRLFINDLELGATKARS